MQGEAGLTVSSPQSQSGATPGIHNWPPSREAVKRADKNHGFISIT